MEYLQQHRVAFAQILEDLIEDKFKKDWSAEDKSMVQKLSGTTKIVKWRNDVHHARRMLTQEGQTAAVGDWVCLLPAVGKIKGELLADYQARLTLNRVLELLNDKD